MFNTRQIECILTIAEEHSIRRAAERLYISQSAISQQLASLRRQGIPPIFYRQGNRLELTETGKLYVNSLKTIMTIRSDAMDRMRNPGNVEYPSLHLAVIRTFSDLLYDRILPEFKAVYPGVLVNVQTFGYTAIMDMLSRHQLDLAVYGLANPANLPPNSTLLCRRELVLFGPEGIDCSDLPIVMPSLNSNLYELTAGALRDNRIKLPVYAYCNSLEASRELVQKGLCVGVDERDAVARVPGVRILPWTKPSYYYLVAIAGDRLPSSSPAGTMLDLFVLRTREESQGSTDDADTV